MKKLLTSILIGCSTIGSLFAADFETITESVASIVVGRDILRVNANVNDTSKVFIIDKYNNKVLSIVCDDGKNTANNSGDLYNIKVRLLQAVAAYDNENKLYFTPSKSADSVLVSAMSPDSSECDTTHFTSKGLFYYSFQSDYTRAIAIEIQGLTGTRVTGGIPVFQLMVSQRKRK